MKNVISFLLMMVCIEIHAQSDVNVFIFIPADRMTLKPLEYSTLNYKSSESIEYQERVKIHNRYKSLADKAVKEDNIKQALIYQQKAISESGLAIGDDYFCMGLYKAILNYPCKETLENLRQAIDLNYTDNGISNVYKNVQDKCL